MMERQAGIFVLIPGAWMGAWVWEPVTRGLRALGHRVHPITLSGLAEGSDVAEIGLATHVDDVLSILEGEDLHDAIVVGHVYAGLVAVQVADRAPERVARTVFVEAFLPRGGQSMLDVFSADGREAELRQIAEHGGRWPAPILAEVAEGNDLSAERARWLVDRFVAQPGRTISEPAVLERPLAAQRATYIACAMGGQSASEDAARMRDEASWTFRTLDPGHWPMVSAPDELVELLAEAANPASSVAATPIKLETRKEAR
jgi:pimeloyl-ACP methyl ester carboxylesterase